MPSQVKIVVDADMAKAFSAFTQLVDKTNKAEKGMEKLATAGNRAERAQTSAIQKMVGRVQAQTRNADLALSQADRAALRMGVNPGGGALGTAIERRMVAQDLREQRAFERFQRAETSARIGRAAGSAYAMDSLMSRTGAFLTARTAAATTSTFNAGTVGAWGAYARGPSESALEARARADVSKAVGGMSELKGKVSEEDLQNMTQRRLAQLQGRQQFRDRMAGGALAVGAAVAGVINEAENELGKYSETLVRAEDQLSTLYGVDKNPAARSRLRSAAIGTSIGSGLDLSQIGELQGRLASTFGDLPADVNQEAVQAALRMAKIGTKDVTSAALGLGAGYMAYGKKLGPGADTMRTLSNRLVRGADIGGFDVDTVTPHLASVYNAFNLAGYSDADAVAAMTLVSKSGMDAESYMTGLRNIPLMMMKGEAKGKVKRTGGFLSDVGVLGGMSGAGLTQLVGKENTSVAVMMKDNQDLLKQYVDELSKLTASVDVLGQKISSSYSDQMFPAVETIKSARQVQANAPLMRAESPAIQDAVSEWEIRKAGAELNTGPMTSFFKTPAVWMETLGSKILGGSDMGQYFDLGLAKMVEGAEQSGDVSKASYLRLRYGQSTGSYFKGTDENGAQVYTGEDEANDLMRLRAQGYNLNSQGYLKYRGMQLSDPDAADAFLEAHKPKPTQGGPGRPVGPFGRAGNAGDVASAAPMFMVAAKILAAGARDTNAHTH